MSDTDTTTGRDSKGHFAKGNRAGRGNPYAKHVQSLRREMFIHATPEKLGQVVDSMIAAAIAGDTAAAKIVLGYCLGDPLPFDLFADLEALQEQVRRLTNEHQG